MFKEYFSFELKNRKRQIHFGLACSFMAVIVFAVTIFVSFFNQVNLENFHLRIITYELGLWIFSGIYFCTGVFSHEGSSVIFLQRTVHSKKLIYWVKLLVLFVLELISGICFLLSKLVATAFVSVLKTGKINIENVGNYAYFFLFIPLIIGIVMAIDLKVPNYLASFMINFIIFMLLFDSAYYFSLITPINPWSKPIVDLVILIIGIALWFLNSLPIMNRSFFKRIRNANYSA